MRRKATRTDGRQDNTSQTKSSSPAEEGIYLIYSSALHLPSLVTFQHPADSSCNSGRIRHHSCPNMNARKFTLRRSSALMTILQPVIVATYRGTCAQCYMHDPGNAVYINTLLAPQAGRLFHTRTFFFIDAASDYGEMGFFIS